MHVEDGKLYFILRRLVSPLVLFVLVIYTYGYLAVAPYVGFQLSSSGGMIRAVFVQAESGPTLQVEDVIERIEGQNWADYDSDRSRTRFAEYAPGSEMKLQVGRNGRSLEIMWKVPNRLEAALGEMRLLSFFWLAYIFWICGLLTVLLVRPRDERWLLLVVLYYLLAVWLMTGSITYTRVFASALVLPAITS